MDARHPAAGVAPACRRMDFDPSGRSTDAHARRTRRNWPQAPARPVRADPPRQTRWRPATRPSGPARRRAAAPRPAPALRRSRVPAKPGTTPVAARPRDPRDPWPPALRGSTQPPHRACPPASGTHRRCAADRRPGEGWMRPRARWPWRFRWPLPEGRWPRRADSRSRAATSQAPRCGRWLHRDRAAAPRPIAPSVEAAAGVQPPPTAGAPMPHRCRRLPAPRHRWAATAAVATTRRSPGHDGPTHRADAPVHARPAGRCRSAAHARRACEPHLPCRHARPASARAAPRRWVARVAANRARRAVARWRPPPDPAMRWPARGRRGGVRP